MPAIANNICKRKSEELDAAFKVNIRMEFLVFGFFWFVFFFLLVFQLCRILQQLCSNNSGVGLLKKYLFDYIFSTVILASHSSYSLSPLGVAMRSSQLLIGSFYLF